MSKKENNIHTTDRFRGWTVTMLYFALGLFSLVLTIGLLKAWDHIDTPAALIILAGISSGFCFRSGFRFYKVMRANVGIPRLHLTPFLLIVITLLAARLAFAG